MARAMKTFSPSPSSASVSSPATLPVSPASAHACPHPHPHPHPVLEALEARLAPAGLITLTTAGGVLTITGDGADNGLAIIDVPGTGQWQLDNAGGLTTTFILNGVMVAAGTTFEAQNSIKATLGDGNDALLIDPSAAPSSMLTPGGISINAGKGNDEIRIGTASSDQLMTGAVTVDLGEGNDQFATLATSVYSGAVKITGGLGNDEVRFDGASADQVFLKGLTVDMGIGDDTFAATAKRFAVAGALNVTTGGGVILTPTISFSSDLMTFDGPVTLSVGSGASNILLGNAATDVLQFGAGLKINGGTGADTVSLRGIHTYAGAVAVDLKDGGNKMTIEDAASFTAPSLSVKGGSGTDHLLLDDNSITVINGALTVSLGSNTNTLEMDPGAKLTAGSLAYTGGTGMEFVDLSGASFHVLGSMSVNLGADGNSDIDIAPAVTGYVGGNLTFTGAKGADDLDFNTPDLRIGGGLKFALGAGSNTVDTAGMLLQVAGGMTYTGGKDSDFLVVSNDNFVVARNLTFTSGGTLTSDQLFLRPVNGSVGSVAYTGGAGLDSVLLGHVDGTTTVRLTINGAVSVNLGAGLAQFVTTDAYVHGATSVVSTGASIDQDGILLQQSTFNGPVTFSLGAGGSLFTASDVFMRGAFTLNTGGGDDTVNLDTSAGTMADSYWFGTVKILTGAGEDVVTIGTNPMVANAANHFYRNLIIDGGADADTLNPVLPGSNTFHGSAVLQKSNFP